MAGISDEKLEELRERVDVASVVGRRVQLKRSGRDLRGLCPFHGEKTPSFYVVPDKRIYHCFGCGKTGDAIKFVMELEGKSFRESVEQLANEFGVVLESEDPAERKRAQRRAALAEVNEKACVFYERVLWEHPKGKIARDHLEKRGISVETAKAWRLGYAPNLWDSLSKSLGRAKVDPQLIDEAGLAVQRKGGKSSGLYDRFRGRLVIPIRESGRTVAFGGRLLEGESEAKYLNSPETPLYQKGNTLFGLDKAREAVRREGVALFVEGYFDAIGLHQAGIQTALATCGTAMTERHLEIVSRAGAKELVFVFDGDGAGIRAATRASELAAAAGVTARVLVPPDGEDPDETVARIGTPAFRELLRNAEPSLQFLLERALAQVGPSIEARVRAVDAVAGIVRAAPNALARELYTEKIAEKLGASAEVVKLALEQSAQHQAEASRAHAQHAPRDQSPARPQRNDARANDRESPREDRRPGAVVRSPETNRSGGRLLNQRAGTGPNVRSGASDAGQRNERAPQAAPRDNRMSARPSSEAGKNAQPVRTPRPPPPARRDASLQELNLVAWILQSSDLARIAEGRGGASTFTNATLRELAERIFAQVHAGAFDRDALISTLEDDALRQRLSRLSDEAARGREGQTESVEFLEQEKKRLSAALAKHERTAASEEIARRVSARTSVNRP